MSAIRSIHNAASTGPGAERGAALIVALVFLLLMTMLGVTTMRTTIVQDHMAGNLRDSDLAFQSAEEALREGEQVLQQASLPAFDGTNGLLQAQNGAGQVAFWNAYAWDTGSRSVTATVAGVAAVPQFVIEELPPVPSSGSSLKFGALPEVGFYRVTARGVGGTTDAVAVLQSTYRR